MRQDWVITTCGKSKYPGPMRADRFYTGSFVKKQGEVAKALNPTYGRIVLSNKYGFMRPDYVIPGPYDSHWGYADSMKPSDLKKQVKDLGIKKGDVIICLGAAEYARQTKMHTPLGVEVYWAPKYLIKRGMGHQMKFYNRIIKEGLKEKFWERTRIK